MSVVHLVVLLLSGHVRVPTSFPIKFATVKLTADIDRLLNQKLSVSVASSLINVTVFPFYVIGHPLSILCSHCCLLQYNAGTGELSLVGDASVMEYQTVLNSVVYSNTSVLVDRLLNGVHKSCITC